MRKGDHAALAAHELVIVNQQPSVAVAKPVHAVAHYRVGGTATGRSF
jgi:hypothetical protein